MIDQIQKQIEASDLARALGADAPDRLVTIAKQIPVETNHTHQGFDFLVFKREDGTDWNWSYYIPYLQHLVTERSEQDAIREAKIFIDFFLETEPASGLRKWMVLELSPELALTINHARDLAIERENAFRNSVYEVIRSRYNFVTT